MKRAAATVPITAKIRLGWNDDDRNAVEQARALVDGGADALTVHGRTRNARYRIAADWDREVARMGLEIGDIDTLPLARTLVRWPDCAHCAAAVSTWMQALGLPDLLDPNDLALMACRGVHYHHDAAQYGHAAFCNLFLSEDKGLDLHFAALDLRIPLQRGTVLIFDTAQPHAVIPRNSSGFNAADFRPDQDCTQIFLTWELPMENEQLRRALRIDFDVDAAVRQRQDEQLVSANGTPLTLCPATGQWRPAG